MCRRCYDPRVGAYKNYGARGIFVCDTWRNDFTAFRTWAEFNGYQDDLEIDRIDNDGPYCPDNCQFVTCKINTRKTRRCRKIAAFGEVKCGTEWVEDSRCRVTYRTLLGRLVSGWDAELAITKMPKYRIEVKDE